jgi:dCMP deaminase
MNRINKGNYYLDIALAVSKRSNCLKRHYGCVIVKNDEIIATGYNGSPRGLSNCCDLGFCKRLDKEHNSGDYSDCHSVHAEQNAMLSASRKDMIGSTMYLAGEERRWSDINQSFFDWSEIEDCEPCPICARMLINSGIKKVINSEGEVDLLKLI